MSKYLGFCRRINGRQLIYHNKLNEYIQLRRLIFPSESRHGGILRTKSELNKWTDKLTNAQNTSIGDFSLYFLMIWITMFGMAYASAPLYRQLCQKLGWGGQISKKVDKKLQNLIEWRKNSDIRGKNRKLLIRFDTRTGPGMEWEFEPIQTYVITRPGESTLAFFKATNYSNNPQTGLSTYTILPFKIAPYFIKIQCFCFEEQRLRGNESVDMPVLFFVDPSVLDNTNMYDVDEITLSYIFYPVNDDSNIAVEADDYDDDPGFWDTIQNSNDNGNIKEGSDLQLQV